MNFTEAMEYLTNLTKFGFNFGLGRIEELLQRLGNPHQGLKVIHIGGTNGKGSTTAMLASILKESGYRVGMFTSPHLHSYTERYLINGEEIPEDRLAELITGLCPHLDAMVKEGYEHPTEFEVVTAIAFLYFYQEGVDFLVLEVGLGGAIDSTNVVLPLVSVITNVGMDHMDYLGNTIKEIAGVKAGIIKPGTPLVTAAADPEALAVLEAQCKEKGAPMIRVGRDVTWECVSSSAAGQYFNIQGRLGRYEDLWLSLIGRHQLVNAATAVAAVEVLAESGIHLAAGAVRSGLATARWPARLEIMRHEPLVLIDSAHNYDGARILRQVLDEYFGDYELVLVLGMLGDKERARVVAELAPAARAVVVTRPNSPRAGDWQDLAEEVRCFTPAVYLVEDVKMAVEKALELARKQDLVCITGSIYMVAEARELFLADIHRI